MPGRLATHTALVTGASTYSAAKGGVANLTRALAVELGPQGVRVNAINPGIIETSMTTDTAGCNKLKEFATPGWRIYLRTYSRQYEDTDVAGQPTEQIPLGRDGQVDDVADAALFLASAESSYVTGHNLVVDGGYTAQ